MHASAQQHGSSHDTGRGLLSPFRLLLFPLLLCCSVMTLPTQLLAQTPLLQPADPSVYVDPIITQLLEDEELQGVSVALTAGSLVWSKGYGLADRAPRRPLLAETPNALHELAQLFTAVAVLQLDQRGLLRLDDSVQLHLPAFRPDTTLAGGRLPTLRELLSHHSGLPAYHAPGSGRENFPVATNAGAYRDVLPASSELSLVTTPGTVYEYSWLGYSLLALVVEAVSGMDFTDYVAQHILQPLGLQNTALLTVPDELPGIARAYIDAEAVPQRRFRDIAAAGLVGSAADMAVFMHALLSGDDSLLDAAHRQEMFRTQHAPLPQDQNFTAGLGVFTSPVAGGRFSAVPTASHASTDGIARSYLLMLPAQQLGVLLTTNSQLGSVALRDAVDALMIELLREAAPATGVPPPYASHLPATPDATQLDAIVGLYAGPAGIYEITRRRDDIRLDVPMLPFVKVRLLPRDDGWFGVELRLLGLRLGGSRRLHELAQNLEGRLVDIDGTPTLYWYWRGIAAATLTALEPARPAQTAAWRQHVGRFRSAINGVQYRLSFDAQHGVFTYGSSEGGFGPFREPPELYCVHSDTQLRSCGIGLVGNGTRNVLTRLDDGSLRNAYGERFDLDSN